MAAVARPRPWEARSWEAQPVQGAGAPWPYAELPPLHSLATRAAVATATRSARWGARQTWRASRASARAAAARLDRNAVLARARSVWDRGAEQGWSLWSTDARLSVGSIRSHQSLLSMFSLFSAGSVGSIGSAGSVLCVGSAGSILSIGSAGSILSIGSAGSVLAIGGVNQRPRWLKSDGRAAADPDGELPAGGGLASSHR